MTRLRRLVDDLPYLLRQALVCSWRGHRGGGYSYCHRCAAYRRPDGRWR